MLHKVITVAQQKGGAGKTTVAAHLIVALAQRGLRVAGLDTDPQGSLSAWYETRQKYFDVRCVHGIEVSSFSDWWRVRPEIDRLRDNHDVVVIDCPPHVENDAEKAVKEADLVVVPIQPSPTDLWATTKTINLTNEKDAHTYLLLNRIITSSKLSQQFMRDLPRCRFKTVLCNRVAYAEALGEGKTVSEAYPASPAAEEIRMLTDEILTILMKKAKEEGVKPSVKIAATTQSKKPATKAKQETLANTPETVA
jgi:chromosome partitioning protein